MTLIPVTITVLMQRNPISIRVKIQGDLYQCCYLGGQRRFSTRIPGELLLGGKKKRRDNWYYTGISQRDFGRTGLVL